MTDYNEIAKREYAAEAESFERCDTDGFMSQWAHGLAGDKAGMMAELQERGGEWDFPALFDLEGNRVAAKLVDTKFGTAWAICDAAGQFKKFVSAFPARESTMAKKGFKEGREMAPAKVEYTGNNICSVRPSYIRKDRGYPADAKVIV